MADSKQPSKLRPKSRAPRRSKSDSETNSEASSSSMALRRTTRQTTITSHFIKGNKRKTEGESEKTIPDESAERDQDKKRRVTGTERGTGISTAELERVTPGTPLSQEEQGGQEHDRRLRRQTRELTLRQRSREEPDREARPGTHKEMDDGEEEKDKRRSRPRSQPRDLATKRRPKEAELEQMTTESAEDGSEEEREEKKRKVTPKEPTVKRVTQTRPTVIPKTASPRCPQCGQFLDDPDLKYQQHPPDAVDELQMLVSEAPPVWRL